MSKKKIVLACVVVALVLAIAGGILLTKQRSLNDVINNSADSVSVASMATFTTIYEPICNYWTNDDAEIQSLIELLSSTQVSFSGWEQYGVVSSYDSSTLENDTEYHLYLGNSQIIVTPDGVVHYCSRKYTIRDDQVEAFLAQLAQFSQTWESTDSTT